MQTQKKRNTQTNGNHNKNIDIQCFWCSSMANVPMYVYVSAPFFVLSVVERVCVCAHATMSVWLCVCISLCIFTSVFALYLSYFLSFYFYLFAYMRLSKVHHRNGRRRRQRIEYPILCWKMILIQKMLTSIKGCHAFQHRSYIHALTRVFNFNHSKVVCLCVHACICGCVSVVFFFVVISRGFVSFRDRILSFVNGQQRTD